jgi:hypothetical protein
MTSYRHNGVKDAINDNLTRHINQTTTMIYLVMQTYFNVTPQKMECRKIRKLME